MSRKKKEQVVETRSLREQLNDYIREIVVDFEAATGMTIKWIVQLRGIGELEIVMFKHLQCTIDIKVFV